MGWEGCEDWGLGIGRLLVRCGFLDFLLIVFAFATEEHWGIEIG